MLTVNIVMAAWIFNPSSLLIFFTNWCSQATWVMTGLVIWYSFDPKIDTKMGWLALLHIVTELTTAFNVVSCSIYWPVLHKLAIEHFS